MFWPFKKKTPRRLYKPGDEVWYHFTEGVVEYGEVRDTLVDGYVVRFPFEIGHQVRYVRFSEQDRRLSPRTP